MSGFSRDVEKLRPHLEVSWTDDHRERLIVETRRRRERHARGRRLAAGFGGGLALAACVLVLVARTREGRVPGPRPPAPSVAAAPGPLEIRYADGSRARALRDETLLAAADQSGARTTTELRRGAARFEVAKNPSRQFCVVAGPFTVVALGTVFSVDRLREGGIEVAVAEGQVRVDGPGPSVTLGGGERRRFRIEAERPPTEAAGNEAERVPTEAAGDEAERVPTEAAGDEAERVPPSSGIAKRAPHPAPGSLAARAPGGARARLASLEPGGRVHDARPPAAPPTPEGDRPALAPRAGARAAVPPAAAPDPERLLAQADEALDRGDAGAAVALLDRLAREHPGDPRTPLAVFAAGKVLLERLARPREAAAAFARARALSGPGPLAEDALAREVDSWAAAGDVARARQRAAEYEALYPAGHWRPVVRARGGSR